MMRKVGGVSLTELMVTVAIVSVIGAGAYVGVQQLEQAQNSVQTRLEQQMNANLLLPLLEIEQARHGQNVIDDSPVCLLSHNESKGWQHTCVPNQQVNDPTNGFLTCRRDNEKHLRTVIYFVEATDPDDSDNIFYGLLHDQWESEDCDLSAAEYSPNTGSFYTETFPASKFEDLDELASNFVLSNEVRTVNFRYGTDGLSILTELTFESQNTLIAEGNSSSIQQNELTFESEITPSLIDDPRPILGWRTTEIQLASGGKANLALYSDRPVLEEIEARWALGTTSGSLKIPVGQTQTSGSVSINYASTARILELLPSQAFLLSDQTRVRVKPIDQWETPDVRIVLSDSTLAYGGTEEQLMILLTGVASGPTTVALTIDDAECNLADGVYTLQLNNAESCSMNATIEDGTTQLGDPILIQASSSGSPGTVTLSPEADDDNSYGIKNTGSITLELTNNLPEVEFIASAVNTPEPAYESRLHRVPIAINKPFKKSTDVTVKIESSSTASCGSNKDYTVANSCSDSTEYVVKWPAGAYEHFLELELKPDSSEETDETIKLTIVTDEGYTAGQVNSQTLTVEEITFVSFKATAASANETDGTLDLIAEFSQPLSSRATLRFDSEGIPAASGNSWLDFEDIEDVSVNAGSSSAPVTITITNDDVPEGREQAYIKFKTLSDDSPDFIGDVLIGSNDRVLVTVTDEASDKCYPAGDLTIGSTTAEHFHHNTSGTNEVTKASIRGGSIQIDAGFDPDNDRLRIRTASAAISTNLESYNNFNFDREGANDYTLDITYTPSNGVMKILVDGTGKIAADHLVEFFNDYVEFVLLNEDYSDTSTRDIVFTLGDAQAWDLHEDGTIHYYRYVDDDGGNETGGNGIDYDGINWTDAFKAASAANYFGANGYLATITSRAENNFLAESFLSGGETVSGWLGGSNRSTRPSELGSGSWPTGLGGENDPKTEYVWGWVTGPETDDEYNEWGRKFWSGLAGCGDPINASSGEVMDIFPYNHSGSISSASGTSEQHVQNNKGSCTVEYSKSPIYDGWKPYDNEWRKKNLDFLSCVSQNTALNGNSKMTNPNAVRQLHYGYAQKQTSSSEESKWNGASGEIGANGRVDPDANTYRFSNFGCTRLKNDQFHQPDSAVLKKKNVDDNTGFDQDEYYLQLTGYKSGGYMWNDLPNDPEPHSAADKKPFEVKGYYIEWGGDNVFANKKLSQTNTVTPYKCQVEH